MSKELVKEIVKLQAEHNYVKPSATIGEIDTIISINDYSQLDISDNIRDGYKARELADQEQSIIDNGIVTPVTIDQYGRVIDGKTRVSFAIKHGLSVPCYITEVEDKKEEIIKSYAGNVSNKMSGKDNLIAINKLLDLGVSLANIGKTLSLKPELVKKYTKIDINNSYVQNLIEDNVSRNQLFAFSEFSEKIGEEECYKIVVGQSGATVKDACKLKVDEINIKKKRELLGSARVEEFKPEPVKLPELNNTMMDHIMTVRETIENSEQKEGECKDYTFFSKLKKDQLVNMISQFYNYSLRAIEMNKECIDRKRKMFIMDQEDKA